MSCLDDTTQLPGGALVRGRGLRNPAPGHPVPEFGLYLGTRKLRARHSFTWPHEWLEWPDFLLPRDTEAAVTRIRDLHRRALDGQRVEVACGGGVGRTGTVMAALAILSGVPAAEAVTWTRGAYHPRAVETPWQRRWLTARFVPALRAGADG
ncbi:protein-tyrosine phosphatase family protein [Actinophytocola glycyrrhizae]|uniref:Protein-tyrosine phosphatase family protein n=1 Tax=Actinophytocola glycyrrhizae TaxID=2044873 RepID=A0ABV9RRM4_9PSEU